MAGKHAAGKKGCFTSSQSFSCGTRGGEVQRWNWLIQAHLEKLPLK